jgi:hypothetical protein
MTTLKSKIAKASLGLVAGVSMLIAGSAMAATFNTNLTVGSRGADVTALQTMLGINPPTGYFGPITKAALATYQASKGISPAAGYFGPLTRAFVNANGGATSGTSTVPGCTSTSGYSPITGQSCATGAVTPSTGPVSAMLSVDNPASGTVLTGQATADLMHVTFTGNGTISSVSLQRTGLSLNTDLSAVYLYQGATRITDSASVNSNGLITFTGMNLAVSGSVTVSVRADIASGASGSDVGVTLTSFTASGSAVTANVAGNRMAIATGSSLLGTTTVTMANTSGATASVNAGTTNYTLWTAPIQVSTHAMSLKGASFHFVGSAPTNSIANLNLYVDGIKVASSTGVNSYSYVVFDLTGMPYALTTGSHTMDVRGDVVNGAARTVTLSLQNAGDLMISDNTLGVNVAASAGGANQTAFPLSGYTISISTGSLSIAVDPAFTATTNVTGGATNAVIARYKINSYGEDEKITSVSLTPVVSGASATTLANVQLYLNGSQIGSVCQFNGSTACSFTLGSSAIVPGGATASMLEVRADIQSTGGTNYSAGTISVSGTLAAQGMYSYNTLTGQTIPATTAITIATGQMVVAKNGAYTNQTVSPSTANVKIGSYTIQNQSSSEAVRVTNFALALTTDGSTALTATQFANFTNVKTSETSGNAATPQNGAASLNFSPDFTVAAGATKTVDVYADIGTASQGVQTTLAVTAYGASSNVSVSSSAVTGQLMSVSTGSVSAPTFIASSSTTPQYIATAASATDASKQTFQFTATNGAGTLQNLKFAVVNSSATSNTVASIRVGSQSASVVTPSAITAASTNYEGQVYKTTSTQFTVSSTTNIPVGSLLKIDSEYMLVTAVPSATTFYVTRGVIGSTAATHATGSTITPSGLAYITNVNASVPNGTGGAYIDAYATYSPANGTTGAVASGSTSNVYLTYVKSQIGSTVVDGAVTPAPASTTTNLMTTVGSKPSLSVNTTQQTGLVIGAENKVGEVTVTADAAGTIGVKTIVFTVGGSGFATGPIIATGARLADGSTTISTATTATTSTPGSTTVVTVTFSSDYLIPAGTSKTFSLYGTVSGTVTSGATVSVSTALTTAGFTWTDTAGNGGTGVETGSKIYNFPTGSYSIRQ